MSLNNNVDQAEIAKFEAIAQSWWDEAGEFAPLHRINPLRLEFIERHCGALDGQTVIDVGCGGGILAESMARHGAEVTGIDMAGEPLQVARLHGLESGIPVTYLQTTAEAYAADHGGEFDVVTCMEMLEHVPDPASVVHACARLVRPGGQLFFSTINRNLKSYLLMIVGAERVAKMVPSGTHDHGKFIKPSELLAWCDAAGLEEGHITGVQYLPLLDYFRFSRDVDVNYLLHCRRPEEA